MHITTNTFKMVLQNYPPGPAVAAFVRTFRLIHYHYQSDGALPMKAYPPRPEHCLCFYARDPEIVAYQNSGVQTGHLSTVVFGQQTEVTHRLVGNHFLLIQIVFQPGALYQLTGIPSSYLTNQYIDATTIFSPDIKHINNKINDCKTHLQMIRVVENFIFQIIRKRQCSPHPIDYSTAQLFTAPQLPNVDDLAKSAFHSTRHFERHFKARMGVSPKYFLKVLRFENAFRMKNKNPTLDWFTIAIACGYYDYQHLAKDYKDLTGLTPNQFHDLDAQAPERLFGEADTY